MATQLPEIYFNFYGRVAWRFEPFQDGMVRLRQGFEAGLSSGHVDMGFYCLVFFIKLSIVSGANLKSTLQEIDSHLRLLKTYKSEVSNNYILNYRETVSLLIEKGGARSTEVKDDFGIVDESKLRDDELFYHKGIRAFWLGHTEQCQYNSKKFMSLSLEELGMIKSQVEFYHGKEADYVIRVRVV